MNKISILFNLIILSTIIFIISGCSSGSRYATKENAANLTENVPIRVLVANNDNNFIYEVKNTISLYNDGKEIAIVKEGNTLNFSSEGNNLDLTISDKIFKGKYFEVKSKDPENKIFYNGHHYRGFLKIVSDGNNIKVINRISLEDYLKGVIPSEMPIGPGESYFQALKAFSICARTYAVMKMGENNSLFDVYLDTRDQVYGGADVEKPLSNRAVDETKNLILTYNNKPAKVYYSAACGGHTENASNVFKDVDEPYLKGVNDGDPPYCSIEPGFEWTEKYPANVFVDRLRKAGYISSSNFSLKDVEVKSRFESGHVNELQITLASENGDRKVVVINGNNIRSIIRRANNRGILRSTMFNIFINNEGEVIIDGKGNGHGVGLCQWGAIAQSIDGKNYRQILSFYFPGTDIQELK